MNSQSERHLLAAALSAAALSIAIGAGGCAAVQKPSFNRPFEVRVAPGKPTEECLALNTGDPIAWRFEATRRVDFDIHYHRGRDVVTPVRNDDVENGSGALVVKERETYCLTWTTRGAVPAFVRGEITLPSRQQ